MHRQGEGQLKTEHTLIVTGMSGAVAGPPMTGQGQETVTVMDVVIFMIAATMTVTRGRTTDVVIVKIAAAVRTPPILTHTEGVILRITTLIHSHPVLDIQLQVIVLHDGSQRDRHTVR